MSPKPPHILSYAGQAPQIGAPLLHAGMGTAVLGRATLGRNAWLGALSVIRADGHVVKAGDDFHLGARSTLHITHDVFPCIVGDRVSVGENACVHACTVGSDVAIGDNTVILDGAVVGDNVVFEAGSTVFPGKEVPGGFLYAGSPARPVRPLEAGEVDARRRSIIEASENRKEPGVPITAAAPGSEIDETVFIASTATVRGQIVAAPSSSVFFSNELDAGAASISIGPRTNIQDNTVIRCASSGFRIGRDSTIGHNVTIHDSIIGDETLIGIGSTVAEGTVIGDRVLLAASARTEPGQKLESGWLYAGSPARQKSRLDADRIALIARIITHYCRYAQDFKALERELPPKPAS